MIDQQSTLFEITEKYPQTIAVFVSNGFPQMEDATKRATMGKSITLSSAIAMKKMDVDAFVRLLEEAIHRQSNSVDVTLAEPQQKIVDADALNVVGILPCPVRIPLMEKWTSYLSSRSEQQIAINHELKAASMGLDWVEKNLDGVHDPEQLPDLFISAGFDMFFDQNRFGRFRRDGIFTDLTDMAEDNRDFADLQIHDPKGYYSMISMVPALFLINTEELGEREAPRSWKELLDPKFEKSVSLPVSDFDLFNAILLNIHKEYGDDGVKALGRSLMESMHPAQMVKSEQRKQNKPAITIMPYFFTKMVKEGGPLQAIWPEDGAIVSPIFILAKESKAADLKEVVQFFASEEVGNLLAVQGLFPSTHPKVENVLPESHPFMWLGWDYIEQHDLSELIAHCKELFNQAAHQVEPACAGGCCS